VRGPLFAPGGPFLRDARGRVVLLHGVNVVYKHPPFEVYPDPGKPWNFDAHDASLMARLGFDVVRLGMTWKGLEPGTAPANNPAICTPGRPGNPHQFDAAVLDRYLSRLKRTVNILAKFHIFTILDMHQDVYNELFDGEGAPNWAVCTDGLPNDVVGNLQGQFDLVWGKVAKYFANDPWVIGFDPFNEPFAVSLVRSGDEHFDAQLECFYTGRARVGIPLHGAPPITCPPGVPKRGVIPTLLENDPRALVFDEPDNYANRGLPTFLGPMPFGHLVFNFHVYCGARNPKTGNPTNIGGCIAQEARALQHRSEDRREMRSSYQRNGPAWLMSEFGATSNPTLLGSLTAIADHDLLGWTYWSWRYYADPTGSAAEALVMADGRLRSTARVLARVYPEAVAGTPLSMSFDPAKRTFTLAYRSGRAIHSPTVIQVPVQVQYPSGYCAKVTGGAATSAPTAPLLTVRSTGSGVVHVTVHPGHCQ
jgi:endoglycosylceramidase